MRRSWRGVSLRSSRQPPSPVSAHSTVMNKQLRSCMFRRESSGGRRSLAANDWRTAGTRRHQPDHSITRTPKRPGGAGSVRRSYKRTFLRLTDRSRLRRLEDKLLSKGAWQQVTRIDDLCHIQVSHKWLSHVDACTGSVLTPNDHTYQRSERLGGQYRSCSSFLDPQLEHAETCSSAEATRGHYACVHAVVSGMKLAEAHGFAIQDG